MQQTINGLNLYDLQKGLTEEKTAQELSRKRRFYPNADSAWQRRKGTGRRADFGRTGAWADPRGAGKHTIDGADDFAVLCDVAFGGHPPRVLSGEVAEVCGFLSYALAVSLAVRALVQAFAIGSEAILEMTQLMQAMFPVLITLLTAVGSLASAGVFQAGDGFFNRGDDDHGA